MNDDDEWDEDEPLLKPLAMTEVEVIVTDNPVVARLLGPTGETIRERRERRPFGF